MTSIDKVDAELCEIGTQEVTRMLISIILLH